jgi:hypothetical protein
MRSSIFAFVKIKLKSFLVLGVYVYITASYPKTLYEKIECGLVVKINLKSS